MSQVEQALSGVVIFVTAARAGSFTSAADRLGITKSAVGKSIAKREERLAANFFIDPLAAWGSPLTERLISQAAH
ncbi:helix-turn-helix domain-containing protein [Pseudomonas syringae]|uniref:helix-turn-helix domain-containing protein n=1 Tax=Pseudomonas syringae TaxID=317 RepID=UPI00353008BE